MDRGERVRTLLAVSKALADLPSVERMVTYETFFGDAGSTLDTHELIAAELVYVGDENLAECAAYLEVATSGSTIEVHRKDEEPLRVFASHLAKERRLVGDVGDGLRSYGISVFVAHDTIDVDVPWESEIVRWLNGCHVGVAFLHPDFHTSYYCMQEVGWLLGREVPIARLMSGEAPRGLLGSNQALQIAEKDAMRVVQDLLAYLESKPTLAKNITASYAQALEMSPAFRYTDHMWRWLRDKELTETQCEQVIMAAEAQRQVYLADSPWDEGRPYRQAIADRLMRVPAAQKFDGRLRRLRDAPKQRRIEPEIESPSITSMSVGEVELPF